ncbi:5-dehydro-4-deoxy-D-glucuronate isomerase [Algoriphagus jejuensis]|uniref:4-deoxy-L-threo-5-hexosulose-uronate ketol-isomerase n=1 Tax=Algoriphagus jejuensis TaxID=419934 RepID=A0ABN1MWC9_9BACT
MINTSTRYATHPSQVKQFDTAQLREHFLIETLFVDDTIELVYSHFDRLIVGGIKPVSQTVKLETFESLKANYFLERREIGLINVGGTGTVIADGESYTINPKEAIYLGRGVKDVSFASEKKEDPALFYFNSAPAHAAFPIAKTSLEAAETVVLGSSENANHRTIRKLIIQANVQSCQLQMGLTELKPGSVWNTMPPHTHDRRMEAYFYFNISEGNTVSHFMGQPEETRHIWMKNNQAVISPPWSIHCGVGTANYSFIWGMAGENLDYGDMDQVKPQELR